MWLTRTKKGIGDAASQGNARSQPSVAATQPTPCFHSHLGFCYSCTMTFHDFGKRKKHEQDMGRAAPNHTIRVGKRHCPLKVCHKTLTIDVMHEGPLAEDLFATHTHVVQHPFCWTCRTPFAHGRLLEEHAIATRHRLHPAQLTMYQFSKVGGVCLAQGEPMLTEHAACMHACPPGGHCGSGVLGHLLGRRGPQGR